MPAEDKKIAVDVSKIRTAINAGIPLSVTTYTFPHEMEMYMHEVLSAFLSELQQNHMIEYLDYCLKELIINAKKANTKRVYFKEKGLDITKESDYELGMETCKTDTLKDIDHYLALQKKEGLYVKLVLQFKNNKIKIEVRNNSELTVFEYKRIHDKLSRAQQYTSIEEAFDQILDSSEGAGLGLIIMILMLEKIGLTDENFQTLCEHGETITRIVLPLSEKTQQQIGFLSDEFVKLIDRLPQFPDNIAAINRLLNDPDSKMSDIAMQISNDISLTGELLKMVNSAAFSLTTPCSNVADAVKLIGIRGIKNLLYSIGSMQTFNEISGDKSELWAHAYQVAFYSYNIARNFCSQERAVIEDSYVCGLLHDMGKIIFETANPDLIEKIQKLCEEKEISPTIFEKLVSGVNHGEIGALVAKKWNFPDSVVDVIRYHHDPLGGPQNLQKLISVVYIADLMTYYQKDAVAFYQIDPEVLAVFKITTEAQFKKISDQLVKAFQKENSK